MAKIFSPRAGDLAAISLSGFCLAHCLALPLVAAVLPVAGVWAQAEWVHWALAISALPISLLALTRRPAIAPLSFGVFGLGLLFAGAAGFPTHEAETSITVLGGLAVVAAHVLNWTRRPHHCD